jgi:fatty acid desaturase
VKSEKVLSKDELFAFQKLDNWHEALAPVAIWGPLLVCFWLASQSWWLLPLAWIGIASRMHAMAAMAHEAAHGVLFKNKFLNQLLGSLFFAFPILVSLKRYEAIHMLHHRKLFTESDPDRPIYDRYPVTKKRWHKYLLRDLTGRTLIKNLFYFVPFPKAVYPNHKDPIGHYPYKSDGVPLLLYWLVILAFVVWSGLLGPFLVLWVLPYCTLMQVLLRVRGALEHGNVKDKNEQFLNTRTVQDSPFVLFLMAPMGLNYHLEHHLYPTVPWYRLKLIHQKIRKQERATLLSSSYRKAIGELLQW